MESKAADVDVVIPSEDDAAIAIVTPGETDIRPLEVIDVTVALLRGWMDGSLDIIHTADLLKGPTPQAVLKIRSEEKPKVFEFLREQAVTGQRDYVQAGIATELAPGSEQDKKAVLFLTSSKTREWDVRYRQMHRCLAQCSDFWAWQVARSSPQNGIAHPVPQECITHILYHLPCSTEETLKTISMADPTPVFAAWVSAFETWIRASLAWDEAVAVKFQEEGRATPRRIVDSVDVLHSPTEAAVKALALPPLLKFDGQGSEELQNQLLDEIMERCPELRGEMLQLQSRSVGILSAMLSRERTGQMELSGASHHVIFDRLCRIGQSLQAQRWQDAPGDVSLPDPVEDLVRRIKSTAWKNAMHEKTPVWVVEQTVFCFGGNLQDVQKLLQDSRSEQSPRLRNRLRELAVPMAVPTEPERDR